LDHYVVLGFEEPGYNLKFAREKKIKLHERKEHHLYCSDQLHNISITWFFFFMLNHPKAGGNEDEK
jgi:hypothetical protein